MKHFYQKCLCRSRRSPWATRRKREIIGKTDKIKNGRRNKNDQGRKIVTAFAAFAIGTTLAAGVALTLNSNMFAAFAATADDETTVSQLETGTNEISLVAGVAQTFAINSNSSGIYGFELPYTTSEEDGTKTYDEFSAKVTVNVNGTDYGALYTENPVIEVELGSPLTATVTLTSDIDVAFGLHLTYEYTYSYFNVDAENSISLAANTYSYAIVASRVAGYYIFDWVSGAGSMDFTYYVADDIEEGAYVLTTYTYTLNSDEDNQSFYVYLESPRATIIPVYYSEDSTLVFELSYSATEPNASEGDLIVGTQTVNASAWGEEYTFTAVSGGVYVLYCEDENAYIMVETEYGSEEIDIHYNDGYEIEYSTYTFALTAGESVTFFMCTNDWGDDTYEVTISTKSDLEVGTRSVYASYFGEEYTFASENGGTYTLSCDDKNAYLMIKGDCWSEEMESPYIFTLGAGESITFLMATERVMKMMCMR